MTTVFTKIINGEIPGTFVYRDEHCVAFLSINPIAPGHLLIVPRLEIDEWTDLPTDIASHVMGVSHRLGQVLKKSHPCIRVGLIIAGYEINHCHIHVIPTRNMGDLDFKNAAQSVSREELQDNAQRIRAEMSSSGLTPSE
jgi:histidine triad (HIT) family protein